MREKVNNCILKDEMIYKEGMTASCRKTGKKYDPMKELFRLLEEQRELFIRMKSR